MRYAIPLIIFLIIAGFLVSRLLGGYDPHIIPSVLIGKPAPEFQLPELREPTKDLLAKAIARQGLALERLGFVVRCLSRRASFSDSAFERRRRAHLWS